MREIVPASNRLKAQKNFTRVPNEIIEHDKISPQAKMVWIELWKFCFHDGDGAFPGMETIGEELNWSSENTVRKYREELEDSGLLKVNQRGQGKTNIYYLYTPEPQGRDVQETQGNEGEEDEVKEDKDLETEQSSIMQRLSNDDPSELNAKDLIKLFNHYMKAIADIERTTTNWGKEGAIMKRLSEDYFDGPEVVVDYLKWVARRKADAFKQTKNSWHNAGMLNKFIDEYKNWRKDKEQKDKMAEHIEQGAPEPDVSARSMEDVREMMGG